MCLLRCAYTCQYATSIGSDAHAAPPVSEKSEFGWRMAFDVTAIRIVVAMCGGCTPHRERAVIEWCIPVADMKIHTVLCLIHSYDERASESK